VAIIHLGRPLPDGSSDLPGNAVFRLGADNSWHFPIWSCTTRSLPGRGCYHPRRWALTSPFHPSPPKRLAYSLLHLSSATWAARSLTGSLSYGVRTFLFCLRKSDCPASSFRTASGSIAKNV